MERKKTLVEVIKAIENGYQNPLALNDFVNGQWVSISTQDMLQQIKEIALGLADLGVKRGQKIALLAFPSSTWSIVDMAIIISGAVSVPIFANISEESLVFEIEQTDARTLFLGSGVSENLYPAHKDLFKTVICMSKNCNEPQGISLEKIREGKGKRLKKNRKNTKIIGCH